MANKHLNSLTFCQTPESLIGWDFGAQQNLGATLKQNTSRCNNKIQTNKINHPGDILVIFVFKIM